jgi:very-short-patch-repair endonuclease
VTFTYDPAINYAFQQNSIPVLRELVVRNGGVPRKQLKVSLRTEPAFAEAIELHIQSLEAEGEFKVGPLDLKLDPSFLENLTEQVTGCLHVEVHEGERVVAKKTESITLLAKNEWCGLASLPEILGAFVLPNDPAVMPILSRASKILDEHTGRGGFNGYQDKSRKRAWEQVGAIYKAIGEVGIRYMSPPVGFENTGQKVRFPSDIVEEKFGTCLDLALLFCACCEQAGLHPLILVHEGHAYAGCWLEDRTLEEPAIDDLQRIRKLVEVEVLTVVETTALASETGGTLQESERNAKPHLTTNLPFRLALDVRRARISRIQPLPIAGVEPEENADGDVVIEAEKEGGLGQREFPDPVVVPAAKQRTVSRIDQWKSRLLDLSLRNRMLNFKSGKGTIPILYGAPEHVEDELSNSELSVQPKPKMVGEDDPRNAKIYSEQQKSDWLSAFLKEELAQRRLRTDLEEPEHSRRLTELYRGARLAVEENGTNTLFAAVGVLEWRETEHSERVLRAPLLLVPVELKRKSILEGFVLRKLDEDSRLNVTLIEMLRQQFQKEVPGLDPLPEDENGVNVGQIFQIFREAVRDLPGWEVKSEVWLGQFSFTKFLLWKDLNDRLEALTENRVVRHLLHESGLPFPNPPEDVKPPQLDDQFHPHEIFCPRSADSSQLAAVMAAGAGHDFVLEGPPGTGKSQTITNIIAHCLAHGKRVLFVAEKRAALDVVHRRLKEEGLEPFCLELHSNKSGKAEVLNQFEQSLKFIAETSDPAWERKAAELEKVRDSLNGYSRALHRKYPCGLSAYDCFDYLLPRQQEETVQFSAWPKITETDEETLTQARDLARVLQERWRPLGDLAVHPLRLVRRQEWSPAWAERTLEQAKGFARTLDGTKGAARELRQWMAFNRPATSSDLARMDALAETLLAAVPVSGTLVEIVLGSPADDSREMSWPQLAEKMSGWVALLEEREKLRASLKRFDEAQLLQLDLKKLQTLWSAGESAWFLTKCIRTSAVRRELRTTCADKHLPEKDKVPKILTNALRLKEVNAAVEADAATMAKLLGQLWASGANGTFGAGTISAATLEQVRLWSEALHLRVMACAENDPEWLGRFSPILVGIFAPGQGLSAAGNVLKLLTAYREEYRTYTDAFEASAGEVCLQREALESEPDYFEAQSQALGGMIAGWSQLRSWTSWQKARHEAESLGLGPIIARLEAGGGNSPDVPGKSLNAPDVPALFERSFRRALLFAIIENEEVLRDFFGPEHEERIERFRKLDDKLGELAREVIRTRLAAKIPRDQLEEEIPKAELGLLRKEIGKKTRHMPVRQLLSRIPQLLPCLKPCVLMSPLSVAQYLEASHKGFDVVIFDEASQIPVWDSVGAIARGTQLIVVGDPKQLPPTNFFNASEDADEDVIVEQEDLESILDELLTQGLRHKRLQWHYRSRHEGLIAFSNRHYYENDLLTFPSPQTGLGGVRFVHLPEARYDKGKTRTNPGEARALVAELVQRLRTRGERRSFGVVTFSQAQQELIENLLDDERRKHSEIEGHFGDAPPVEGEPVFVKSLESVQGDERDVILFSIGYGVDETGQVSMNFGPLNREGGERRLNVAITRAKHEVVVFSGLRGEQIDLTRSRARGVRDLKHFLEYAERGPKALVAAKNVAGTAPAESGFEQLVEEALRAHGYEVHRQVGCSDYRIDLAVLHPDDPGRYLLGIECDGLTYGRAATARDRDKLRQGILEGLGWKVHHIWSTDWWHDRAQQTKKLVEILEGLKGCKRSGKSEVDKEHGRVLGRRAT